MTQVAPQIEEARKVRLPSNVTKVASKDSSAVVYLYTRKDGHVAAAGFRGRRTKPEFRYMFHNDNQREKHVSRWMKDVAESEAMRKKTKNEGVNEYQVGDIFYTNWGYEQTNVEFFEVVRTTQKSVIVRQVDTETTETLTMQGTKTPIKGSFKGGEIRCLSKGKNATIRIDSYRHGFPWDGRPKSFSSYA